jgi:uncharacterized SAM-binding protein YcdF (DUF218 family)
MQSLPALDSTKVQDTASLSKSQRGSTAIFILCALAVVSVIVFPILIVRSMDPRSQRSYSHVGKPPLPIGAVQSIQFVGHGGMVDTQINTDQLAVLVEGAISIRKGVVLEWRRSQARDDLCIVKTNRCWDLMVEDVVE